MDRYDELVEVNSEFLFVHLLDQNWTTEFMIDVVESLREKALEEDGYELYENDEA